jgi:hypothetical protein
MRCRWKWETSPYPTATLEECPQIQISFPYTELQFYEEHQTKRQMCCVNLTPDCYLRIKHNSLIERITLASPLMFRCYWSLYGFRSALKELNSYLTEWVEEIKVKDAACEEKLTSAENVPLSG